MNKKKDHMFFNDPILPQASYLLGKRQPIHEDHLIAHTDVAWVNTSVFIKYQLHKLINVIDYDTI